MNPATHAIACSASTSRLRSRIVTTWLQPPTWNGGPIVCTHEAARAGDAGDQPGRRQQQDGGADAAREPACERGHGR